MREGWRDVIDGDEEGRGERAVGGGRSCDARGNGGRYRGS